jgi:WD40 repeat protein
MGPLAKNKNFNPFPGLRPFMTEESDWFFGRDVEMEEIYTRLLNNRFITLIGSAGCGKTSLINCGVIPLVRHHHIDGESEWRIISFRPGNDPIGNLAVAISEELTASGQAGADWRTIQSELFDNPVGIGAALRRFISNPQEKVLLVIDQFEELFRLAARGKKEIVAASVAKFVGLMVEVINQPDENIFSIISLRSDFMGESSRYHGLTQLINNSNYLVPELNPENCRKVVEGPIVNAGARIDPRLISAVLFDLGGRPEQLPVLQHAMMRTWAHWQKMEEPGQPVSVTDYESAGKLGASLSSHAEEIYEGLTTRGKKICEVLFRTITEKGPDSRGLRNPASISTIRYIAGCDGAELSEVVELLRHPSACFVTPLPGIPMSDDSVIDLTQEILIRLWDRSKEWVEQESASAKMYLRLSEASAMYQQGKTGLLKPPDLQLAINWREEQKPTLPWAERYNPAFERAIVYLRTSEGKYIEEEANKLRLQKKRVKRIRIIASGLGLIALIAIGYLFFTIERRAEADRVAKNTRSLLIQAVREKERADSTSSAALEMKDRSDSTARIASQKAEEAIVKVKIYEDKSQRAERETAVALQLQNQAIEESDSAKQASFLAGENARIAEEEKNEALRLRMLSVAKTISVKSVLLQGRKDLQALLAFQAYLFNKRNSGPVNDADIYSGLYNVARQNGSSLYKTYRGHDGDIKSIAFVPGKREFFTSSGDGKVLKWSLEGRDRTFRVIYSGTDIINVLAVSPDASWLACGSENASIKMIPLNSTYKSFEMTGHNGKIRSLIFSYDSKQLYSAALDGKVLKWEISARTFTDVSTGSTRIASIDISRNGDYIAGVSSDGKAIVWNPGNGSDKFSIETKGKNIRVVKFNPDNNLLALGDADGNVELWDVTLRRKISSVKAHSGTVNDIRFNASLNQMATAGDDKAIRIFDIKNPGDLSEPPLALTDNDGIILVIEFSPDSRTIVSGASAGVDNLVSRPTHVDLLVPEICNYVSRNMNQDEWNTYVGKNIAYENTCPGKSYNIKIEPIRYP